MTKAPTSPEISLETVSRVRLLPKDAVPRPVPDARTTPLSILDNTVVRFSLTSAAWYFDPPSENTRALSAETLIASLKDTVNAYPQWAGQLHWLPYDPARGLRHGRVGITYGSPSDPGIELIHARCPHTLHSLVPDRSERMKSGAWDADSFPSTQLVCPTSLALHNTNEFEGRPCVSVQITEFACGDVSVGLRITHAVADATAMTQFVKDWAAVHRARLSNQPTPPLSPIFDPSLVDAAAGDVKGQPDPSLVDTARSLPMLRYDWWRSANGCPAPMLPGTQVPPELASEDLTRTAGDPMPWSEWDILAPVGHTLVYFSPEEVQRIWQAAASPHVSRLDALLAFIWTLIVRARGMGQDTEPIHMAVTLGLRPRISPPLPASFLGSPITLARVTLTGKEIASPDSLSLGASAIRAATAQFTPTAVGALLHEMAHDVNAQHIWRAFLGRRHSIVTSWQGLDVYEMDFGTGAPRYVDVLMPSMDGCIHVMEAAPAVDHREGKRWYDEPVSVSLHLAKDVLDKVLRDPELRRYRGDIV